MCCVLLDSCSYWVYWLVTWQVLILCLCHMDNLEESWRFALLQIVDLLGIFITVPLSHVLHSRPVF